MGRRAFLARLALHEKAFAYSSSTAANLNLLRSLQGRSAFESPASDPTPEQVVEPSTKAEIAPVSPNENEDSVKDSSNADVAQHSSIIASSWSYDQKYDPKGYPENASSRSLNRRWRHSVNDVLATLGVCATKGHEAPPVRTAHQQLQILYVRFENYCGFDVHAVDYILNFVVECWSTGLRQRLQANLLYCGVPLTEIVASEWGGLGSLRFLFSGTLSGLALIILDTGLGMASNYAFGALKTNTAGNGLTLLSRYEESTGTLIDSAEKVTHLVIFLLTVPLEFQCTLQQMNLVPEPLYPYPRNYLFWFFATPVGERWLGYPDPLQLSCLIYIWFRRKNSLRQILYQYCWAALPKPTCPDQYSLLGAQEDGHDSSTVAGLVHHSDTHEERANTTVTGLLAKDLQSVGRYWQVFYDRCTQALSWDHLHGPSSNLSGDHGRDQVSANDSRIELSRGRSHSQALGTSTEAVDLLSNRQESPQNAPNHFSPPVHTPSPTQSNAQSPDSSPSSHNSSPVSSQPATPWPIELTSHDENGETHIDITLTALPQMTRQRTMSEVPHPARNAAVLPNTPALTEGILPSSEQSLRPNEPTTTSCPMQRQLHRMTALTAHPAHSMARRLSSQAVGILLLPLEALFVRYVAMTFLSSSYFHASTPGVAALWRRGGVYPLRAWFGPGLGTGDWKGIGDYIGKMVLVQGIEAGLGFVTWQVGVGVVWWVGRTWCDWRSPESADSTRGTNRDGWNEDEPLDILEM